MYYLQSRWIADGKKLIYYGLRKREHLFQNEIRLSKKQAEIVASLPRVLTQKERATLGGLIGAQVVTEADLKTVPRSLQEAAFCKTCCANDFMIPGLELDGEGLCPLCTTIDDTKELRSILPIRNEIGRTETSRFDVGLFYTGGKDSTFLLYYLSVVCNLRVLAMTWEIPFLSESAKQSIENAKKRLSNVEFITRTVNRNDLQTIYRALYEKSGNCCACPSLAYVLFYPELVANRVPYFVAGNEPVQMLGLYYNHIAPKIAYTAAKNKYWNLLINVGRVLSLRPPLKPGQFHTLATMKQLAYGDHPLKVLAGYRNDLVSDVTAALHALPEILRPLKKAIRHSSRTGQIPAFVHIDLDEICGDRYDWTTIRQTIVRECGWVAPDLQHKALHTSCRIEKCKEHSQFIRFYHCRSRMIPFSALEIALASRNRTVSREDSIKEIEESLGFSLEEIPECAIMKDFLEEKVKEEERVP